jgi:hypothetical protein
MTQEALKLALQTLELSKETMESACKQIDELKAENKSLKEALAVDKESLTTETQPEQEPVAHQKWCASLTQLLLSMPPQPAPCNCHPPQRTWQGLTDEEQQQAYEQWQNDGWGVFYSAIEAKLKEKNT